MAVFRVHPNLPQDSAEFMGWQSMTWDSMSREQRAEFMSYWQSIGCNPYLAFILARKGS